MWTEITRPKYDRTGLRYASDLTDAEWRVIEPHMPAAKALGRPRTTDLREVVNAILYVLRSGCPWRLLPKDFLLFGAWIARRSARYLNYDNRYADLLFEVVTRRYLNLPVLITTNKPFSVWADVFSSAACVVTLVDRLIHRSEIVQLDGESYRLREAKEQAAKRSKARSRRSTQSRASRGTRS